MSFFYFLNITRLCLIIIIAVVGVRDRTQGLTHLSYSSSTDPHPKHCSVLLAIVWNSWVEMYGDRVNHSYVGSILLVPSVGHYQHRVIECTFMPMCLKIVICIAPLHSQIARDISRVFIFILVISYEKILIFYILRLETFFFWTCSNWAFLNTKKKNLKIWNLKTPEDIWLWAFWVKDVQLICELFIHLVCGHFCVGLSSFLLLYKRFPFCNVWDQSYFFIVIF